MSDAVPRSPAGAAMSKKKDKIPGELLVCSNPKARQSYEISERLEAGLVLLGSEVKSMRARRADLEGAYAAFDSRGELWLHKMHVAPYEQAGPFGHEPKRSRKLLISAKERERYRGRLTTKGFTLVPLRVYFREGWAKVELGLGKGKKTHDDRESIKRKVDLREAKRAMGKRR